MYKNGYNTESTLFVLWKMNRQISAVIFVVWKLVEKTKNHERTKCTRLVSVVLPNDRLVQRKAKCAKRWRYVE